MENRKGVNIWIILISVLIVLIIIAAISYLLLPRLYSQKMQFSLYGESPVTIEKGSKEIDRNLELCLQGVKYKGNSEYTTCEAITKLDSSICSGKDCLDQVKFAQALNSKDKAKCSEIIGRIDKMLCISAFEKDDTMCNSSPEKELKIQCSKFAMGGLDAIGSPQKSESVCTSESERKSYEMWCKATLLGEKYDCSERLKYDCYAVYNTAMAVLKKDTSLCDNIKTNSEEIENCRRQVK
jgi:hypothetical protein